jgi:hypothetical protein
VSAVIPQWCLRTETPVGTRWYYPRPVVTDKPAYYQDLTWTGQPNDAAVEVLEFGPGVLVSTSPLTEATATWTTARTPIEYRQVETLPEDLTALAPQYPDTMTPAEWDRRCSCDNEASCLWCAVRWRLYNRVMSEPAQAHQRFDMSEFVELPGDPDPEPSLTWELTESPLTAFYGRLVAHLFPGLLLVPFDRVVSTVEAEVAKLDLRGTGMRGEAIYAFRGERKITSHVLVPWDEPVPYRRMPGRSQKARDENAKRARASTIAMTFSAEVVVPKFIRAASKAEAVAALQVLVDDCLARLIPPHTVGCSHCHGLGFVQ